MATAPGREQPILQGLDAEFTAGEVIGIVGPSGAGKSTLARCLVGIWPDTQGEVLLDGQPIGDWQREELGPHLGYLPQDIELFDGTIAENIARFGEVDSEQVIEAARRTGLHDMILRFPKGYDTPMGEAGSLLSGGQRQRIGLARALYGDPALVVLDEPNANLDDAGEAALVQALRDLKARGKTVFMIVHQPHLLATADRVLVLEQGQVTRIAPVVVKHAAAPTLDSCLMKNNVTDVEAVELQTDTRAPVRLGFWVLVVGFGLFLAWAAWAPLDEGVVGPGHGVRRDAAQDHPAPAGRRHQGRAGAAKASGSSAATCWWCWTTPPCAPASSPSARTTWRSGPRRAACWPRPLARPASTSTPTCCGADDAVRAAVDGGAAPADGLAPGRAARRDGGRPAVDRRPTRARPPACSRCWRAAASRRRSRPGSSSSVRALAAEGYAPRNQALQLEQQQAELTAGMTDLRDQHPARAQCRRRGAACAWPSGSRSTCSEVSIQLAEVRKEVQANQERLAAVTAELERMVIKSPVDGQVVGLALAQAGGGVVTPGQKLMDIVPEGETLLLDAKVPPQVIDRIKAGENAEVRFSSLRRLADAGGARQAGVAVGRCHDRAGGRRVS